MYNIIPTSVKEAWPKMHHDGLSVEKIGNKSNCSRSTVSRYLNSLGIKTDVWVISKSIKSGWFKMYKSGLTMKKIAEKSNCSFSPVQSYLKTHGVQTCVLDNSIKEEWPKLYESGLSLRAIGLRYGCGDNTVKHYLNMVGIKTNRGFIDKSTKEQWPKLYLGGLSCLDIAKKFKCSDVTVLNYLKNTTIKIRTRNEGGINGRIRNNNIKGYTNGGHGYLRYTRCGKNKRRAIHRVIMEEHLGRPLTKKEVVHHIDGNKTNNDISNLQLFSCVGEHTRFHAKLRKEKKLSQVNHKGE